MAVKFASRVHGRQRYMSTGRTLPVERGDNHSDTGGTVFEAELGDCVAACSAS
jgi:hypothetical protein